jgi:(p)ppGpp synthase/HD superfamily hydrolase
MSQLVATAYRLARHYHFGQTDKLGAPYLDHVVRVAEKVAHLGSAHAAVALLHDVLEDTDATESDLIAAGIDPHLVEAVVVLTKTGGPNSDYYARVRRHGLARTVKMADVADNADPDRLMLITDPATRERLTRKYAAATDALR